MTMKIMYFVFIFIFTASVGIAQNSNTGKTTFAILGGVNFQNFTGKDFHGSDLNNELVIGYHAGVNAQIPIVPEFYFQPGLLFSTKGAKNTAGGITNTYTVSYIELPLNLVYKGALGSGFVMVGLGPYV
nr:outer membrane beta-barrel protein [Saprospiraceae bacterium]